MRLSVSGLACSRGGRLLFEGIGFELRAGQGLLLEGPNGSGKTTLLRAIAGLLSPNAGDIALLNGMPDASVAEQAHYAGHLDAVKPTLTVRENLQFWADYLGGGAVEEAQSAFALDAIAHLPARFLSQGQRRKLALSRLLLSPRPLWLLDEPSVSLDRRARGRLAELMAAHMAAGGLLVAATHTDLGVGFSGSLALGDSAP